MSVEQCFNAFVSDMLYYRVCCPRYVCLLSFPFSVTAPAVSTASVQCKSVCPSVRLSVCPSVRLSVCPSVRLSVCPSVRLSVCTSVRLSVCPSVRLSVCPSVRLSVYPSVRLSLSLWSVSVCLCLYVSLPSNPSQPPSTSPSTPPSSIPLPLPLPLPLGVDVDSFDGFMEKCYQRELDSIMKYDETG